jgi:hypothetical protein
VTRRHVILPDPDAARAEFNAWVRSTTGTFFSSGAETSNFYYGIWRAGMAAGRKAERERCAAEAEHWQNISGPQPHKCGEYIAAAIRALGDE